MLGKSSTSSLLSWHTPGWIQHDSTTVACTFSLVTALRERAVLGEIPGLNCHKRFLLKPCRRRSEGLGSQDRRAGAAFAGDALSSEDLRSAGWDQNHKPTGCCFLGPNSHMVAFIKRPVKPPCGAGRLLEDFPATARA